ncbi:polyprenyl synthetase family protein [Candidatus Karelsulcia muelleri]|uniref:Polyprenyl synthetase family protein n=1 Tax=Candidatus Karelsulcia muelleri TaxID=336810 RepID=A0A3A1MME2_9FLAO|nr:polyprenyl synthetase family protein [Candidatus Karelsulcia muelleri]RIU86123.1 polyprenyl synthetase family protein [Candidatus Karelsulcia muelleri]
MLILTLKKINFIIKNEIEIFETLFRNNFYSKIPLIQEINNYFFKIKGKYIRPIFVFLITKMLGNISKKTYDLAILIELIHTASLIHDDVIDFSNTRRGFLSINAIWQNKTAVIFGDYIFSKSLNIAIKNNYIDYLNLISKTIEQMSEGEILQMKYFNNFFIKEYIYNIIIFKKTAILISACCEGCAKSLNKKKKIVLNIKKFGELAGMAFQIKDDLLDYKNHMNDNENYFLLLREFKITLPFIYALKKTSKKYKNWLFNEFNNKNINKYSLIKILNFIKNSGGIEYSIYKIKLFTNKALLLLNNYPNNKANKSLKNLILFNKERLL